MKDTGTGIDEDKINRIFERFYKGDNFVQGTGLGLAISHTIVEHLKRDDHGNLQSWKRLPFHDSTSGKKNGVLKFNTPIVSICDNYNQTFRRILHIHFPTNVDCLTCHVSRQIRSQEYAYLLQCLPEYHLSSMEF